MLQAQLMTICAGKHVYTSSTVPNVAEIYYSLPVLVFYCRHRAVQKAALQDHSNPILYYDQS